MEFTSELYTYCAIAVKTSGWMFATLSKLFTSGHLIFRILNESPAKMRYWDWVKQYAKVTHSTAEKFNTVHKFEGRVSNILLPCLNISCLFPFSKAAQT